MTPLIYGSVLLSADADLIAFIVFKAEWRVQYEGAKRIVQMATWNVNETEEEQTSIIDLLRPVPHRVSIPDRNGDRVIDDLERDVWPCGNQPLNGFVGMLPGLRLPWLKFRWLRLLQENIFQSGQQFCCSSSSVLMQHESEHDTWRN